MSQQNVNTAAKESAETSLSTDQVLDLYDWLTGQDNLIRPADFTPPAGSTEVVAYDDYGPDYCQVWLLNGWPVAAAAPMDGFFCQLATEVL